MGIIRKTKSLELILNEFNKINGALSAKKLIEQLGHKFNKTTIYRILDKLEEDRILHSFLGKNGLKWYVKCKDCSSNNYQDVHPHFQCSDCGKVDCLDISITIPKIPNRKIEFSQFLIQGKCEECII